MSLKLHVKLSFGQFPTKYLQKIVISNQEQLEIEILTFFYNLIDAKKL